MTEPIRIANCSGYFGDRPSAAIEMVAGGPIDVLTGDWLAELTMLILKRIQDRKPGHGYARTFVAQMEQVMGTCLDSGIKVVANAGGLNPDGCAEAVAEVADRLGLSPTIAYVSGDDLTARLDDLVSFENDEPFNADGVLTANAYLGCWGIVDALTRGADIVITGRVTDAAVVCGPAAWHHGWTPHDLDPLAGAVTAGHLIECSAQVTGGNYSFFTEIPGWAEPDGLARFGYPWAEIASDGSAVIGKHDETGGQISVGTVTSQLLYEIGAPSYLGPDVTARFDTAVLQQVGPDRVKVSKVRGERPPDMLKVATNRIGGYRNSVTLGLVGLDIEEKAALCEAVFWNAFPYSADELDDVEITLSGSDPLDPDTNDEATSRWTVTVKDTDEEKVGRAFSNAVFQTALASIPGMHSLSGAPTGAQPFGVYAPARVAREEVPSLVSILGEDSSPHVVASSQPTSDWPEVVWPYSDASPPPNSLVLGDGTTTPMPLGTIIGARSGDKGGDANLGLFARSDEAWLWLDQFMTVEQLVALVPEAEGLRIERYRFPKIWSLNFVLHGFLGEGVAASTRPDSQAKSLGEWVRARLVEIPQLLL